MNSTCISFSMYDKSLISICASAFHNYLVFILGQWLLSIKSPRPLREGLWSWTPPEYWQTHRDLWLYSMCHDAFAALGKPSPNIDRYVSKIWPWPWTSTLTSRIDLELWSWPLTLTSKQDKAQFFAVWPWPLTYNLDLQSNPSQGQGRPSCQKLRS